MYSHKPMVAFGAIHAATPCGLCPSQRENTFLYTNLVRPAAAPLREYSTVSCM